MNRLSSILIPVTFALAASACGGGSLSSSDALTQSVHQVCSKAFECKSTFPGTANDFTLAFGADEDACFTSLFSQTTLDTYQASIDAGRITYNGDDAQACLDAEDALACDA